MDRTVVVDVGTAVHVLPSGWAHAVGCAYDMLLSTGGAVLPASTLIATIKAAAALDIISFSVLTTSSSPAPAARNGERLTLKPLSPQALNPSSGPPRDLAVLLPPVEFRP